MTILITGATGSMGSALARRLARQGERLILTGRDSDRLTSLATELGAAVRAADLTQADSRNELLQWLETQPEPITGLAHCVGSLVLKPLHLTTEADWQAQLETHAGTAYHLLKFFIARALKSASNASAVLVSSVVAEAGFANHEAVAAAKSAVTGLALSAAASYADRGIRVNVVAPGLTRSNLTRRFVASPEAEARSAGLIPLGRIGEPEDVAATIAFLLSAEARHITGQVIRVDGGQGLLHPLPRSASAASKA